MRAHEPTLSSGDRPTRGYNRREILAALAATGVGSVAFRRAMAAQAEGIAVTPEMISQAEWIAGIELSEEDRKATATAVERAQRGYDEVRKIQLENAVPPMLNFFAAPPQGSPAAPPERAARVSEPHAPRKPQAAEDLAFLPVHELSALIRERQISSVELTRLYLERLHRYNDLLNCVVTFTDDLALKQAEQADREIAAGRYRGPLHGIPWGAKDLISYPGFPTTWGAPQFRERVLSEKATVAQRLDEAGAVLVAKLTLGALAWGDDWFGGITRNPWNPEQGSSGSSAGSASATAAGLVGFSLGSETLGSIVSPCRRCGATGLRPTFGRVSRHGAMTLAWTMDKLGPITRSVEDAALVLDAIHGYDGIDTTAVTQPFEWPCPRNLKGLRVGYFESRRDDQARPELDTLRELGVQLVPLELPARIPSGPLTIILNTESAAAFDELLRTNNIEGLNRWPGAWRQAVFVPAIEYLRANRLRTLLAREMRRLFEKVDLYVGGNDLVITNLTGQPTVVLPGELRTASDGTKQPASITFTGRLFGESELLRVANAYQMATGYHLARPDLEAALKKQNTQKKEGG